MNYNFYEDLGQAGALNLLIMTNKVLLLALVSALVLSSTLASTVGTGRTVPNKIDVPCKNMVKVALGEEECECADTIGSLDVVLEDGKCKLSINVPEFPKLST